MIPPGAHGGSCNVNGSRGSWDLLLDLVRGLEGGGGEGGRAGKNKCVRAWVEGELHVVPSAAALLVFLNCRVT